MHNSNKEDFERMMELAKFGADRHNERRQVEFRVFISYTTLLVLALSYQAKGGLLQYLGLVNNESFPVLSEHKWAIVMILTSIHFVYFLWEIRLSMAMDCDTSRRDFYMAKAQCILEHLLKHPNHSFSPSKCVTVTMKHSKVSPVALRRIRYMSQNYSKCMNLPLRYQFLRGDSWEVWVKFLRTDHGYFNFGSQRQYLFCF